MLPKLYSTFCFYCYFTPLDGYGKRTDTNNCCRGCGEIGTPHILLMEMEDGSATLENSLAVAQSIRES